MLKFCLIAALTASLAAHAASFDCARARTPQEKAICASPRLSAADETLAAAYKAVLAVAPPDAAAEIRAGQRNWLRRMAAKCAPWSARDVVLSEAPADSLTDCLLGDYAYRTAELNHMVLREGGVTFVWRTITLTAKDSPDSPGGSGTIAKPGYGTVTATWPETNDGTPQWKAWNKAIETITQTMAARADVPPGAKWDPAWAEDMDEQVTTSIDLVTATLVSATVFNNWYGHGAAHGNTSFIQLNWQPKEGRELRADDVFRADSGWDKVLAARCLESLNRQTGEDLRAQWQPGYLDKALHDAVVEPSSWTVDADGLTITFEQGSIACHACDAGPVTIPWATIKPLLNPAFVPPTERADKPDPSN